MKVRFSLPSLIDLVLSPSYELYQLSHLLVSETRSEGLGII